MPKNNKRQTISNLFEGHEIRSVWKAEENDYYFSVVDVIGALTGSKNPRNYWNMLKHRIIKEEGSQVYTNCVHLTMLAPDGKARKRDAMKTKDILRLIESVPSPKAEPFKVWLAQLGSDRIDEVFDPELAISRAVNYYRNMGRTDEWIEERLRGIISRNKLTATWQENGITKGYEFAALTNEIYKEWSGMKASEYKDYKGLRKESLRDNMTDIELSLTNLGETVTRELTKKRRPKGLAENKKVAKIGGHAAKVAREDAEKSLGEKIVSPKNALPYEHKENHKLKEGD